MTKKKVALLLVFLSFLMQITGCSHHVPEEPLRYQDDYYEYVNQDLLEQIELTPLDAHWDWFGELYAEVDMQMTGIIRELSQNDMVYEKGSSEQKIKDMYDCVSDMENRNQTGLGPLEAHMDNIRSARNIAEYVDALAKLSGEFGFSSILGGYSILPDRADSRQYAVYMLYADTLLGKEYLEGSNTGEYVDRYLDYIRDMFLQFGMTETEARNSADSVHRLMKEICASSLAAEQLHDPSVTYNVYTAQTLQQLFTNVDVDRMLKTLRIQDRDKYIVADVEQARKINSLLVEENLEALKDYSTFVMLNDAAQYAGEGYARLYEDMQNSLYGITESWGDEANWMILTQELLPWDLGMLYVERYFSWENKEAVEEIIAQILDEYKEIIMRQSWMSAETRQKAVRKLENMGVKIGYPDQWPEVKDLMQVVPVSEGGSLLSNLLAGMHASIEYDLNRLNGPVDKSQWDIAPQTINAFYDPSGNEIIFPAAILQAPFYDPQNSTGTNLGGIGFIIAHEVSHAFDSTGALYDEYGNYDVWWTDEEWEEYQKLSQAIVEYYNGYELIGIAVDGERTLGENIADLSAMACIASIIGDDPDALADAFSQIAYGWASEDKVDYMIYILSTDTHPPNKIRVNAVLSSCDAFYDIYDIQEDDGMYVAPENRVGIWK